MCMPTLDREKMEEYCIYMAPLEMGKAGRKWYVYGNIREGESCRSMVYVLQRWRRENLKEYGRCMTTLGRGKTEGIWYVCGTVEEEKTWRNMVCK